MGERRLCKPEVGGSSPLTSMQNIPQRGAENDNVRFLCSEGEKTYSLFLLWLKEQARRILFSDGKTKLKRKKQNPQFSVIFTL